MAGGGRILASLHENRTNFCGVLAGCRVAGSILTRSQSSPNLNKHNYEQNRQATATPKTNPSCTGSSESADLCQPDNVYWCDGSEAEDKLMRDRIVESGAGLWLNEKLRPNSLLVRSDPRDVARVEQRTFICSQVAEGRRPDEQLGSARRDEGQAQRPVRRLHERPHALRHSLQHGADRFAHRAIRHRAFRQPLRRRQHAHHDPHGRGGLSNRLRKTGTFVKCLHSVGSPLAEGAKDVPWPCNPENTYITHFPEDRLIMSFGSGYGGNALLGKKCFALRIASAMARDEGWMAEHMLILGVKDPSGKKTYVSAAFPERVRQDELCHDHPAEASQG